MTSTQVLLSPAGRYVALESLFHRRLAIDTSIWFAQFLSAMTDERGVTVANAELKGLFRRICKLLFWGIRPGTCYFPPPFVSSSCSHHHIDSVFVFDGSKPEIKRNTVTNRSTHRREADWRRKAKKLLDLELRKAQWELSKKSKMSNASKDSKQDISDDDDDDDDNDDVDDEYFELLEWIDSNIQKQPESALQRIRAMAFALILFPSESVS